MPTERGLLLESSRFHRLTTPSKTRTDQPLAIRRKGQPVDAVVWR